jgi:DNA segregation ATPase FtsK/SpoIIIE, S-DNA-T family
VLREAGWLLLLAVALYLALALATYHRGDPGPFFSGGGGAVANKAGAAGAWIAETLLYLFGISAWWWVTLAVFGVLRLYRRVESWEMVSRRTLAVALAGFAMLLAASAALEALRLHTLGAELPLVPGGVLGVVLSGIVLKALGFTGGTMLLIAAMAAAISIFTGLSWLRVAEVVGAGVAL